LYISTDFLVVLETGVTQFFKKLDIGTFDLGDYLAIGAIFAATDSVCTLQVMCFLQHDLNYLQTLKHSGPKVSVPVVL